MKSHTGLVCFASVLLVLVVVVQLASAQLIGSGLGTGGIGGIGGGIGGLGTGLGGGIGGEGLGIGGNPFGPLERERWLLHRRRLELRILEEQNYERRRLIQAELDAHIGWGRPYGWHSIC